MIYKNRFISGILLMTFSIPCLAQDWVEYVHRKDLFAITFPSVPQIDEEIRISAHGVSVPARIYSTQKNSNSYSLTVIDYTDAQKRHQERDDQTDASSGPRVWIMDVRASVMHAAQNIRKRTNQEGGVILYEGWADMDKIEGHQLQIINSDQSRTYIGIHLNNSRLYILEATAPQNYPPVSWFQQSIQFLNDEGMRIRYTIDPDGQRTDIRIVPLADVHEGTVRVVVE
ncbi:MAG: hypothetical protein CBC38_00700 [Gammaproteobacteria bacterium TMED78]|nr:MAG: hypothetical protein CBC38_00700 [Gammaproteobacteria bacterium TMED78]|tara:strand:- start:82218 stop:82901 length:684 start_codon:yes stop_codon:yes gene_type:complete